MENRRRGSDVLDGPSAAAPTGSARQSRTSRDPRDSQASTGTNASASSADNHTRTQSIAFTTSDHGVVSVNLTDLSNALGVRRGDVVSQRLMFQARSAPSYHIERSLLTSALGSPSVLCADAATTATISPSTNAPSASNVSRVNDASAANTDSSANDGAATVPSPPVARAAHYQRRLSTLRGTQWLDNEVNAQPAASAQSPGPLPASSAASAGLSPHARPRRGTPPPPGGANALRRALAGDGSPFAVVAGSVPSLLRYSGGSLLSCAGSVRPALFAAASRRPSGRSSGGRDGWREEDVGDGESPLDDGNDNERTRLLSPSPRRDGVARSSDVQERDRLSVPRRRSSSSAAASRSSGPPTPTPPTLQIDDIAADSAGPASATSPSRSVHFSENVIESISIARSEDEYMRLLVVYSRPWYAYVFLTVFGCLFSLAVLSNLYLERGLPLVRDRAISVPFMFFLISGFGTVGMLLHLVAVWRPDGEEEQGFFADPDQWSQLPPLWTLGVLFIGGLTSSLVFGYAMVSTVAVVMVIGLVGHFIAECLHRGDDEGGDCITSWDAVGGVVAGLGALLAAASGAMEQLLDDGSDKSSEARSSLQVGLLVLMGWGVSVLVSGICWTLFTRRLREISQRVSQQFLLTSSLAVWTAALGIAAYVINVLLSSDAAMQTVDVMSRRRTGASSSAFQTHLPAEQRQNMAEVLVPCYSLFPDLAILLSGGLCFLMCWYAYHMVSFYVDHIAGAACMIIGASLSTVPLIVLLALHTWPASKPELWAAMLVLSLTGTLALVLGAGMVVYGGVRYRREVEIRIVVD
ncbi:hypothetical protein ABB37_01419 [Leptomonas pyrrhocoris]|uniref:Uncharacterized protein n=1 Tax=Leptomonas pyrrhocoris TaxID=157538 RepID=A0A0M9G8Q3_LEPPY|nr:hypothetical protein ABB37_01419 [Leptomonas pyrrhocoris]KPA84983.1 hypothetical protein ABB37_01419 [Leptomonas pyrrhocoris]|eukprot:XP_015663422.1 hypothetical protein ABB37_01419 [Leptomonas pyrrhocoris]